MSKKINVSVEIGYELRTVKLTQQEWEDVNEGKYLSKSIEEMYEGELFVYEFQFNPHSPKNSTLYVTYNLKDDHDYGEGFIGDIGDAIIHKEE